MGDKAFKLYHDLNKGRIEKSDALKQTVEDMVSIAKMLPLAKEIFGGLQNRNAVFARAGALDQEANALFAVSQATYARSENLLAVIESNGKASWFEVSFSAVSSLFLGTNEAEKNRSGSSSKVIEDLISKHPQPSANSSSAWLTLYSQISKL